MLQIKYQAGGDPGALFLTLLRAAMATGQAHVADRYGRAPESAEQWGWRQENGRKKPMGILIGWLVADDLFLDGMGPRSYQLAEQSSGCDLLSSERAVRLRLRARGLLASIDTARQVLLVRRILDGRPRQVLDLKSKVLSTEGRIALYPLTKCNHLSGLSG